MATKIYGVDGQREAIITVPLANGRNTLKLEFTRGNNNRGAYYRPATCVIADKARQDMIESSPMFKSKMIRLIKVIGTNKPVQESEKKPVRSNARLAALAAEKKRREEAANQNNKTASVNEADVNQSEESQANSAPADVNANNVPYAGVKTIQDARVALKAHGANAGVLMNVSAMKNYMAANNIEFPNFKFEE